MKLERLRLIIRTVIKYKSMTFKHISHLAFYGVIIYSLSSCAAKNDYPGTEYAPQMYHSVPYEGLSQIKDKEAGILITSIEGPGEFYTSNPNNPNEMNMREPVPNTVPRSKNGYLPYRLSQADVLIGDERISPLNTTSTQVITDGKQLYSRFCQHCHGSKGKGFEGDGLVKEKLPGIANLTADRYTEISEGHIFHVITVGQGLMGAHGSQVSPEERWKIARFVKEVIQK